MKALSIAIHNTLDEAATISFRAVNHQLFHYYSSEFNLCQAHLLDKLIALQVSVGKGNLKFQYPQSRFAKELRCSRNTMSVYLEKFVELGILKVHKYYVRKKESYKYLVDLEFIAHNPFLIYDKNKIPEAQQLKIGEIIREYYLRLAKIPDNDSRRRAPLRYSIGVKE